jgi:hypothetical protein
MKPAMANVTEVMKLQATERIRGIELGKQFARSEFVASYELESVASLDDDATFDDLLYVLVDLMGWGEDTVEGLFGGHRPSDAETQGFIEGARLCKTRVEPA